MYWLLFKYQRVHNISFSQENIYKKCFEWLKTPSAKIYKQVDFNDLNHSKLIAKLRVKLDAIEYVLHCEFKCTILCFEKKYQLTIEDFTFSYFDTESIKTIKFKMESEDEWNLIEPYIEKINLDILNFVKPKVMNSKPKQ